MKRQLTQKEIKAMPDATFDEIWWGDFVETNPGEYKEIIGLTLNSKEKKWSITTRDGMLYEHPETLKFKRNPIRDYSGSP